MSTDTDHRNAFQRRVQAAVDAARIARGDAPLFGEAKAKLAPVSPVDVITSALDEQAVRR